MSPGQAQRPQRGEPLVAVLLTWFVPGAGHLYLGRPRFALGAFVLVEGLFLLGVKLSGGQVFEMLQSDLRTALAPVLTPEAGNLGALIWHRRTYPFLAPVQALPWPSTIKLGGLLTAASGILNGCLMVRAHVDARAPRAGGSAGGRLSPATAVLLTWLVPGLGHWALGRRLRGALVFVLLVGLFALGVALAHGSNLDRERHFYYWGGQLLLGLPAIAAELVHGHAPVTGDVAYADAGLVFGCVAGLLNVLAMIDAFACAEAPEAGEEAGAPSAEAAA
jgi:Family of unknown function (DUF6677)